MKRLIVAASLVGLLVSPAFAQDKPTAESLMKQDFDIVGVFPTPQGPIGLLLQNDDSAYMCVVAETPVSADLNTQYCKPIR